MQKPIQKFSLGYFLFKCYSKFFIRKFYKTTTVVGSENIPQNTPVIITPNHQNTLMDALCIIFNIPGRAVFMARSDIFGKSKFISNILRFLKILPIYRIRDGVKQLQNNEASFGEAVGVLEDKQKLVVLPEGSHLGQRRLRQLKKGVARIAFMAEERHNFQLGLQIIPTGLDYSHYINFGSRFLVIYGKPIKVADYKDLYLENPQRAMAALMDDIRKGISPLMLNLDNEAEYEQLETMQNIYINDLYHGKQHKRGVSHLQILKKSQQVAEKLLQFASTTEYANLKPLAIEFKTLLKKLNLRYWAIANTHYNVAKIFINRILQLLCSPLFIIGYLINILPFSIPVWATRGIKDQQFLSSVRLVIAVVVFTIFYLIYLIILLLTLPKIWMAILASVAIPYIGILAFRYYVWFQKTTAKARVNRFNSTQNTDWLKLISCYNTILSTLKSKF